VLTALDTWIGSAQLVSWLKRVATCRFPTAGHLCRWAAMCPGHNESAGKRRSGRTQGQHVPARHLRGTPRWPPRAI